MKLTRQHSQQLGFEALLLDAERTNHARRIEKETGHLPATMADALPFFVELLEEHHAAMLGGLRDEALWCREEAQRLALRLNGGKAGILADHDSPGSILARETAAVTGDVPLWGQEGSFIVTAGGARARIEMDGVFSLGATAGFWLGFSAHVVDFDRPFISETGFRRFLGMFGASEAGITPDAYAIEVITAQVRREMKGRLVPVERTAVFDVPDRNR